MFYEFKKVLLLGCFLNTDVMVEYSYKLIEITNRRYTEMIIQSRRVYLNNTLVPAQVEITGEKITAVYPYGEKPADKDYGDDRILPGFYDVHTHGFNGYDTTAGEKQGLIDWLTYLPHEGVCGFLPTTLTYSPEVLVHALNNVREVEQQDLAGAQILGVHLEGPFINKNHKGAQPEEYIAKPDVQQFQKYQDASGNLIRVITLAPEMDEDLQLTRYCAANGVNVSIGHSDADYETAMNALANGARSFTHTFNAMTPLTHRKNGAVGAAFVSDSFAEIICDGVHVTTAALKIFFTQKPDKGMIVTDSLLCKGFAPGTVFDFGGYPVKIYPDGSAHLMVPGNALAGSTLKFNEGLRILVEKALVPFEVAVDAASINPMKYLGLDDHKGRIKAGYDCDITVLRDDYSVNETYCRGICFNN